MDDSAPPPPPPPTGGTGVFSKEDLSGSEIAGCKVLRKLGQGAMGAVYLAEQISLRRQVALKVLDPKFSRDLTYIERFEREAQAAARLTHFNIVQVFDYGRRGDLYYIVNEFVDGGTVQSRLDRRGALPPAEAADLVLQACRGLAAAEEQKVVHRDIKPDNLMLTRSGTVKIADFGLAKIVNDDATVTQSGMIVGTPFYMSPEQAKGLELDCRSDLYSLGVTFFHMLTGQLPFDAESVIGVLLKQISAERPDPVAVNPALPGAFGPVVLRMMARSPEDRYQNARDLATAIEHLKDVAEGKAEPAPAPAPAGTTRAERYRPLPRSQVLRCERRDLAPAAAARMQTLAKNDAGVFLEIDPPPPEGSLLEVLFSVPGREGHFLAAGLVRWTSRDPGRAGAGVTFLKVNPISAAALSSQSGRQPAARSAETPAAARSSGTPAAVLSAETAPPRPLPPAEAIKLLTQSALHCRLLRYFYANSGQSVEASRIAGALGLGQRMLAPALEPFLQAGLLKRHSSGLIDLLWPEDEGLQKELVAWVSKFGLK